MQIPCPRQAPCPSTPPEATHPCLLPRKAHVPGKVPNKDALLNHQGGSLVASPPKEPCQKEPSKSATNPKEMQRLKQKAKNNRDQPATKRQKSSRVVELAVDKEAKEQGPSKQKIRPRMRPKRNPTPEPKPTSQLSPPPPPPLPLPPPQP
ncbi:hypothetical protein RHS04_06594 [Rhizoctonia solani]|uniref:Uncharacterized protein n=2 Tax=Rhizoctonia solani TaxID=456999 RepID=A0A8H7H3G4_9AGAM|nr:hypothetical protein RHS04_06594 [Rhizoctonia solani]